MFLMRFDDALEIATAAAREAHDDGDHRAWRRLTNQRALALIPLGQFTGAVSACDEVIASAAEHEDPSAVAHAWNISAMAACHLPRDDAMRRVDAAVAIGEWFLEKHARADSLARTAWTAGTIGFVTLGDMIFTRIMDDVEAGAAGSLSPASLLWLREQQVSERLWFAVAQEHSGDPRAADSMQEALESLRRILPDTVILPAKGAAMFHAMEGIALTMLGRVEDARRPLATAAAALTGGPPDLFSTGLELMLGTCVLRSRPEAVTPGFVAHLVRAAQWLGELRTEAEVWRLTAASVRDPARAAAAAERFEALTDMLDWRRRLQEVDRFHLRSRWLREIVDAGGWRPRPYPQS